MRVPSRLPIVPASCHGTPRAHAIGPNTQPRIAWRLSLSSEVPSHACTVQLTTGTCSCTHSPAAPSSALVSATSARNEISIAPTFSARCRPSLVPRPAASTRLTSVFSTCSFTVPSVSGCSVSGTNSLAIISVPGAVMITAVSRCLASMPNRM